MEYEPSGKSLNPALPSEPVVVFLSNSFRRIVAPWILVPKFSDDTLSAILPFAFISCASTFLVVFCCGSTYILSNFVPV